MALPLSGNQLKKLTTRLREGMETPEDLHALDEVLLYYHLTLGAAHTEIEDLCAGMPLAEPMAPRVKTLKTTLEKLHRQPELRSLGQFRDLAGMRVVVHGTRSDQDELVSYIRTLFEDDQHPVKVIDRRADPRSGYRAVHLEVRRDGIPIEIQIRTSLQHRWAELFERAADKFGRGLRYGESVPELQFNELAQAAVALLTHLSAFIDLHERTPASTGELLPEILADIAAFLEELP